MERERNWHRYRGTVSKEGMQVRIDKRRGRQRQTVTSAGSRAMEAATDCPKAFPRGAGGTYKSKRLRRQRCGLGRGNREGNLRCGVVLGCGILERAGPVRRGSRSVTTHLKRHPSRQQQRPAPKVGPGRCRRHADVFFCDRSRAASPCANR